jgi:hypothetical protein
MSDRQFPNAMRYTYSGGPSLSRQEITDVLTCGNVPSQTFIVPRISEFHHYDLDRGWLNSAGVPIYWDALKRRPGV